MPAAEQTRVAIAGVGLIGGSVALSARAAGAHVTGWDPRDGAAATVCDESAGDLATAVAGAEVVVVATPIDQLANTIKLALQYAPDAVVTDVGSVKASIVAAVRDPRYIGGHPLAGAEVAGVEHARTGLFDNATWYLTPTSETQGVRLERVTRLITSIGARPQAIEAGAHDRLMAAVSHLPHVLANVLVEGTLVDPGSVGPSFRDATRVAGANPELWKAIYMANGDALIEEIDRAVERLGAVRFLVSNGDVQAVGKWQAAAAEKRSRLDEALTGEEIEELRVVVPNRPGVLADLALKLGGAGINIHDLSLAPSPDRSQGEVAVWVAAANADRARELIDEVVAS